MEIAPKLTDLQRRFVEAYLALPADTRGRPGKAAIAAGYSEKHATVTGCRLLKHAGIVAAIEFARNSGGTLPEPPALPVTNDPKVWLHALMNDPTATPRQRLDAAKALLPYEHARMDDRGKKEVQAERAAKQGSSTRFRPTPHPGLRVVRGEGN